MEYIFYFVIVIICGVSWWVFKLIGELGCKMILCGIKVLCYLGGCKSFYFVYYKMDSFI